MVTHNKPGWAASLLLLPVSQLGCSGQQSNLQSSAEDETATVFWFAFPEQTEEYCYVFQIPLRARESTREHLFPYNWK